MANKRPMSLPGKEPADRMSDSGTDLLSRVYAELHPIASRLMRREQQGHTLSPTSLVHEAVIRLIRSPTPIGTTDRSYLFAAATRAMREVLVDYARRRQATRRGGGAKRMQLDMVLDYFEDQKLDIVEIHEALERLAELNLRQSEVVSLRYFGGLTVPEIASTLGVSIGTVERDWRIARAWLIQQLQEGDLAE